MSQQVINLTNTLETDFLDEDTYPDQNDSPNQQDESSSSESISQSDDDDQREQQRDESHCQSQETVKEQDIDISQEQQQKRNIQNQCELQHNVNDYQQRRMKQECSAVSPISKLVTTILAPLLTVSPALSVKEMIDFASGYQPLSKSL